MVFYYDKKYMEFFYAKKGKKYIMGTIIMPSRSLVIGRNI